MGREFARPGWWHSGGEPPPRIDRAEIHSGEILDQFLLEIVQKPSII
jgi:hypothetical protein